MMKNYKKESLKKHTEKECKIKVICNTIKNTIKNMDRTRRGNAVCAVLLVLVLVTQFLPFWLCSNCKEHKEESKIVSIAEYIWFPDHHKPITKSMTSVYLNEYGPDYTKEEGKKYSFAVDDIILPQVVIFLGSLVGAVLCLVFGGLKIVTLIPLLVGGVGTFWYLSCPAMQVGANWPIHLVAALLTLLAALATLVLGFKKRLPKK